MTSHLLARLAQGGQLAGLAVTPGRALVVSEEAVSRAGLDLSTFPQREMEIRGKREMLVVRTLVSAAELPAAVLI